MLWIPRKVPVCVFEKSPKDMLHSNERLIFLGRLLVSPVLLAGATGYYGYLAGLRGLRSIVYTELRNIMSAASLDNRYQILDWFTNKGRLIVYVAERKPTTRIGSDSGSEKMLTRLRRAFTRFR
jgi:hypothetical protein